MVSSALDTVNTLIRLESTEELKGCFADIPIEAYHHASCPGYSSTTLKKILNKSMNHLEVAKGKATKAMNFGSAFHAFVNEPEVFSSTYQIIQGKGAESLRDGMIPLSYSDFQTITAMSKTLFSHPDAGPLLKGAQNEFTFFAKDTETGLMKKCRADAINGNAVIDLKSTVDASSDGFFWEAKKYGYRLSAAYYLEVISEALGQNFTDFYFIACEKEPPFEINVFRASDAAIERGREDVRQALKIIKKLNEDGLNAWKGYPLGAKELNI